MDSSAFANGLVAIEQLLFLIDKARGQGMAHAKRALHGIHFLFREFTSADATEYAIVLVHSCLLFALCYTSVIAGPLNKEARQMKRNRPARAIRLTAKFTDVLISIRRRRGGAERKSPKSSIDEIGFSRR